MTDAYHVTSQSAMTPAFDRSRYFSIPRTGGRRLLSLARLLVRHQPQQATPEVEQAGKHLAETVETVTQAFVERHREYGASVAAEEVELDAVMDALWYILRDRVQHWEVFDRPAVRRIAAIEPTDGFDFGACIEQAADAARVRSLLLEQGLEFLRLSYAEQAEHMLTLWTMIEQEKLEPVLTELIGAEFFGALSAWRVRYDQMIERRTARAQGSAINLRALGLQLNRVIQIYVIALLAMIRDDDPENVELIRTALRPIDALREQLERERARNQAAGGADLDELAEDETLDELIAEQQAIDDQLGLNPRADDIDSAPTA